jgi:hypothetical protein
MTPQNMARHRNSPHMSFWRMLKEGYDHFEVTRQEPKVNVCERRYVFNAETDKRFVSTARCPDMRVPEDLLAAVKDKQRRDAIQTADFIRRGTPASPVRTYADGGMHPVFLSAVRSNNVDEFGVIRSRIAAPAGTIPANVRIPGELNGVRSTGSVESGTLLSGLFSSSSGSSDSGSSSGGGMLSRMTAMMGFGAAPQPQAKGPMPKAVRTKSKQGKKPATTPRSKPADAQVAKSSAGESSQPQAEQQTAAVTPPAQAQAASPGLLRGAQPTVATGSFDNRFGAWR